LRKLAFHYSVNPVDRRLTVLSIKERIAGRFSAMVGMREIAHAQEKPLVPEPARGVRHARFIGAAMATRET
jgi:hypothetical protein